jgi:hypothetical protein
MLRGMVLGDLLMGQPMDWIRVRRTVVEMATTHLQVG